MIKCNKIKFGTSSKSLFSFICAPLLFLGCASTQSQNVVQVSEEKNQLSLQLSRDSKSLLANRPRPEALEARDELRSRKDLTVAMMSSVAELSLLGGKPDEALSQSRALLKKDCKNVEAQKTLVKVALLANRHEEALLIAQNALELDSRNTDFLSLRGLALFLLDKPIEARESWKKAIELNPTHISSLMNLGVLYFHNRNVNQAGATFEKVLNIEPNHMDAQVGKAVVMSAQGNHVEARKNLQLVFNKNPKSSLVAFNLAALERERFQNYEASLGYIEKYIQLAQNERMGVERAVAWREDLKVLIAKKKEGKVSDADLRQMASKSSQAVESQRPGLDDSDLTQASAPRAAPQPLVQPAQNQPNSNQTSATKKENKSPAAKPADTKPLDDAASLEEAIK